MKPREKKPETVFRIINRETGEAKGSYSRASCDEFDFNSVGEARSANCHGIFKDKEKYKIAKYRVTYELIEDDCSIEPPHSRSVPASVQCIVSRNLNKYRNYENIINCSATHG